MCEQLGVPHYVRLPPPSASNSVYSQFILTGLLGSLIATAVLGVRPLEPLPFPLEAFAGQVAGLAGSIGLQVEGLGFLSPKTQPSRPETLHQVRGRITLSSMPHMV